MLRLLGVHGFIEQYADRGIGNDVGTGTDSL